MEESLRDTVHLLSSPLLSVAGTSDRSVSLLFIAVLVLLVVLSAKRRTNGDAFGLASKCCTIHPLGVQLATLKGNNHKTYSLFLPKSEIVDVIVSEVILSYKVVSIVLFRVAKKSHSLQEQKPQDSFLTMHSLLKDETISLVPAFPGVEMSHKECHKMRYELSKALGKN